MSMNGKIVKFAIGTKESLEKSNKIFQKVDIYIDGESGILYIVPQEEYIEPQKEEDLFEKYIKI